MALGSRPAQDWRRWPQLSLGAARGVRGDPAVPNSSSGHARRWRCWWRTSPAPAPTFIDGADTAPGGGSPRRCWHLLRAGAWAVARPAVHPRRDQRRPHRGTRPAGRRSDRPANRDSCSPARASAVRRRRRAVSPRATTCSSPAPHGAFALAGVQAASPPLRARPDRAARPRMAGRHRRLGGDGAGLRAASRTPATGLQEHPPAPTAPGPATALVDFVERFDVEWLLDGAAPAVRIAPDGTLEDRHRGAAASRGRGKPATPAWPAGENCALARDADGRPPVAARCSSAPARSWCHSRGCPTAPGARRPRRRRAGMPISGTRGRVAGCGSPVAVATALLRAPPDPADGPRSAVARRSRLTLTPVRPGAWAPAAGQR